MQQNFSMPAYIKERWSLDTRLATSDARLETGCEGLSRDYWRCPLDG
jgi:hypothetical protein